MQFRRDLRTDPTRTDNQSQTNPLGRCRHSHGMLLRGGDRLTEIGHHRLASSVEQVECHITVVSGLLQPSVQSSWRACSLCSLGLSMIRPPRSTKASSSCLKTRQTMVRLRRTAQTHPTEDPSVLSPRFHQLLKRYPLPSVSGSSARRRSKPSGPATASCAETIKAL